MDNEEPMSTADEDISAARYEAGQAAPMDEEDLTRLLRASQDLPARHITTLAKP